MADPKEHTKERFGLAKEVLVIYAKHASIDARVLKAIATILSDPEFQRRVETVWMLLVHEADDAATAAFLDNQTEFVVVPISAEQLLDPSRGTLFLRSRIASRVGSIDVFGTSSPVKSDKYLFGRDSLIQSLNNRVLVNKENCGIFGLRKTGKTSVLYAFQRRSADPQLILEYIDCQNPGIHASRWWQVLLHIIQRLAPKDISPDIVPHLYTLESAGTQFVIDVRKIIDARAAKQIVLLVDEIEYVTPGISGALGKHWDEDFLNFWQVIRAAHQETLGTVTFVVAGVNPASVERPHFGQRPNPIFELATPYFLEPLKEADARSMVRSIGKYAGLRFSEDVYPYLANRFGGHPYLIRIACSEVWKDCETKSPEQVCDVPLQSFLLAAPRIRDRVRQPIKDILLSLAWWYPEEYDLLRILAEGDEQFVRDYLEDRPGSMLQFLRYGVLRKDGDQLAIEDVREFLRNEGASFKDAIGPFTRGEISPTILPEIPDLDALARLAQKRYELEVRLRRAVLLYLGVRFSGDNSAIAKAMLKGMMSRPDRDRPQDLFVGRTPREVIQDLYMLDLKFIIVANWDVFGVVFANKQQWFIDRMDTVNQARQFEAHTKPVNFTDLERFEAAYSWLIGKLQLIDNVAQMVSELGLN